MEVFIAIGEAVAGIFITIMLGGMLAGLIAFGTLEWGARTRVQRTLVEARILERFNKEPLWEEFPPMFDRSSIISLAEKREFVPSMLGLDPGALYSLPYRQLCGQIAANVSKNLGYGEEGPPSTLTTVLATAHSQSIDEPLTPPAPFQRRAAERAIGFIDALQIDLANAVYRYATFVSALVVTMLFIALIGPVAGRIAPFGDPSGLVVRAIGTVAAFLIASIVLVLVLFGLGSLIIAGLTFRWIDRVASAR